MESFLLDHSLLSIIHDRINKEKSYTYQNLFQVIDGINACPYITYKLDPSYLERELFEQLRNLQDDDWVFYLDRTMKSRILEMLKENQIELAEDIPLHMLCDVLEGYLLLFTVDRELSSGLIDLAKGIEEEDGTFILIRLLNEYCSIGLGQLSYYIQQCDDDVIYRLISLYEEWEREIPDKIPSNYIKNLAIFSLKYSVGLFYSTGLLTELKHQQLFNKPFKEIFPSVNDYINREAELSEESYVDLITLGYLASKEGYEGYEVKEVLEGYSLLNYNDYNPENILNLIKQKIQAVKK